MNPAVESASISIEEYLAGEEHGEVRHEYIDGIVYAMAGVTLPHNEISLNLAASLRNKLRGGPCRACMSDVKLRLSLDDANSIFYYPDVVVTCESRDHDSRFVTTPKAIIEVLSESTERIDRHEKFSSYTQIESLEEYVLASQDRMEVTLFRRSNEWKPEVFRFPDQEVELASIQFRISLRDIYDGVNLNSQQPNSFAYANKPAVQ